MASAIHAGANAERILSAPSGDLAGHAFFEMIHVQDRVSVIKCVADCLEQGRLKKVQFRLAPDNAKPVERWFEMRCEPAPGLLVEGEGMLALSVVRDISERRALEQALRTEHEKAESANIAKSRFLANMSHELRTPLNAILGFSELMQSDAMKNMPPERSGEYVGLIHNSATHLLNVLNDILDMSKIEAGKYQIVTEPFDIGATLRASAAMLRGQADKKGIEIVIGDFDGLPEINADERAVKQIMINLVANAVKFTDEGGRVWIGARRNGRNIVIDVSDNGIGISPEHLGSLGMPFYQADSQYDRKYEGTGLGLSVVCGLVDLHEGKVRLNPEKVSALAFS